jgi:hypothetical protein
MIIVNFSCLLISLVLVGVLTRILDYSRNQTILSLGLAAVLPIHWTMLSEPINYSVAALSYLAGMVFVIVSVFKKYVLSKGVTELLLQGMTGLALIVGTWSLLLIDPESISYLGSQSKVSPLVVLLGKGFPQLLEIPGIILVLTYLLMGAVITLSVSFPGLYRVAAENAHQGKAAVHLIGGEKMAAALPTPKEPERYKEDEPIPTVGAFFLVPLITYLLVSLFIEGVIFYQVLYVLVFPFCLWIGAATAPIKKHWSKWILPSAWFVLVGLGYIL